MKIVVDWNLCESNAVCVQQAPRVFRINAQDQLDVLHETPPASEIEAVKKAARMCPRGAISLVDDDKPIN